MKVLAAIAALLGTVISFFALARGYVYTAYFIAVFTLGAVNGLLGLKEPDNKD